MRPLCVIPEKSSIQSLNGGSSKKDVDENSSSHQKLAEDGLMETAESKIEGSKVSTAAVDNKKPAENKSNRNDDALRRPELLMEKAAANHHKSALMNQIDIQDEKVISPESVLRLKSPKVFPKAAVNTLLGLTSNSSSKATSPKEVQLLQNMATTDDSSTSASIPFVDEDPPVLPAAPDQSDPSKVEKPKAKGKSVISGQVRTGWL